MPEDGEVVGLLVLMLLTEARRDARVAASGELLTLVEQDRGTWDAALIAEGHRLVRERLAARVAPGRYQILAAISAVHTSAREVRDTDWSQFVALYAQLVRLDSSPIIALNRAVAVAELDGPMWHWRPSTASRTSWPPITPTMRPAPTCCAGWAAVRSCAPRTTQPSSWQATLPRLPT
jgi:predicted RNA polymerase sigma factor